VIVADSSVWIDYFNGRNARETDLLDSYLSRQEILVGDLIVAEVLRGFREEKELLTARSLLAVLPAADMVGRSIAEKSAMNYRRLRRLGFTVRKTIDLLIGTYCMEHDHELLHSDRDFDAMRLLGLRTL